MIFYLKRINIKDDKAQEKENEYLLKFDDFSYKNMF